MARSQPNLPSYHPLGPFKFASFLLQQVYVWKTQLPFLFPSNVFTETWIGVGVPESDMHIHINTHTATDISKSTYITIPNHLRL